ncbi:MAG: hypothetical protein R3F34_20455 [Planctomycetota bacterium]
MGKSRRKQPDKARSRTKSHSKRLRELVGAFEHASREARENADQIHELLGDLERSAQRECISRLALSLRDEGILDDLLALQAAFRDSKGQIGGEIAAFRLLPKALLAWMNSYLGLRTLGSLDEVLTLDSAKLARGEAADFVLNDDAIVPSKGTCQVTVVQAGWKVGKLVIAPARVQLIGESGI